MTATRVAPGVWRAGTRFVNWYVIDGGAGGLTLIDAGLPAYERQLDETLHHIARRRQDIRALLLTHGHVDHTGMAALVAGLGVPVHLHPDDDRLAADPRSNRTDRSLLRYALYPGMAAFLAHAVAQGALKPKPMPGTRRLQDGAVLDDVPGRPRVTHAPGHTDGSCLFEFREHGVVFAGDLLCTVSPFTARSADPQLQTRGSNRDSDQAMASLERLQGIEARLLLPGHGGPWRDGVEAAVTSARRIGCR